MRKTLLSSLIMLFLHGSHQPAMLSAEFPSDPIVSGRKQVEYLILDPDELLIPSTVYSLGYTQTFKRIHRGYRVTVTSSIEPILARNTFVFHSESLKHPFRDDWLMCNLVRSESYSDALRICLSWLERTIKYSDNPSDLQDFDSVLQRRSGNCVGRNTVLLALLHSIGIMARPVQGCLFQNGSLLFHRWIEVDYAGIGTLPTAPGVSQDFVPPDHLVLLPSLNVDPEINDVTRLSVRISVISETFSSWIIDKWPSPEGCAVPVARRQTGSERHLTALTGQITPIVLPMVVELKTSDQTRMTHVDRHGLFSFLPVTPGPYHLSIRSMGQEGFSRKGILQSGEREHLYCTLNIRESRTEQHQR